jgi:cleavage and polyadenylation specificity factor subunit 3
VTSHSHSHGHHHAATKKASGALPDEAVLERLDSLIGFLGAHFENVELIDPEASSSSIKSEDANNEKASVPPEPTSSTTAPTLKIRLDDKVAYIPLDTLEVASSSEPLKKRVESVVELALKVTLPLSALLPASAVA